MATATKAVATETTSTETTAVHPALDCTNEEDVETRVESPELQSANEVNRRDIPAHTVMSLPH